MILGLSRWREDQMTVLKERTGPSVKRRWILALCLLGGLVGLQRYPVLAFTLTSPAEGAALRSGGTVPVAVEVGKDVNLTSIRYYWYRLDEEPLATHHSSPAPFAPGQEGHAFAGTLSVPPDAIGAMRLLAVGEVTRGRLGSYEEFDEVVVIVEPAAALTSIDFAVERPWRLDTIGRLLTVPVLGQFSDGVARPLWGPRSGSRFTSSNEDVVAVDQTGMLRVTGNGRVRLTVENRGKIGTVEVTVEGDDGPNRPPLAEVEKELHAKSGSLVILDGLRSRDPDGDPLRYEWKQLRGRRIALTNANEVKASFLAPRVSERKLLQFSLTVIDMAGPDVVKGAESRPAVISVWVNP